MLNTLLAEVLKVQVALAQYRPKEAIASLDSLQKKYPHLTYLNFLRVSSLVVLKEMESAKALLKETLKEYPNDQSGLLLARQLKLNVTND